MNKIWSWRECTTLAFEASQHTQHFIIYIVIIAAVTSAFMLLLLLLGTVYAICMHLLCTKCKMVDENGHCKRISLAAQSALFLSLALVLLFQQNQSSLAHTHTHAFLDFHLVQLNIFAMKAQFILAYLVENTQFASQINFQLTYVYVFAFSVDLNSVFALIYECIGFVIMFETYTQICTRATRTVKYHVRL